MQVAEPTAEIRARLGSDQRVAWLAGAVVTIALTLAYFLLYWNRFVALRSGDWLFSLGVDVLAGKLPCRDYFCSSPPLSTFKSALVMKLFGAKLIVLRGFAVFERTVLAAVLYFWLARLFRPAVASLAAIVAIVLSAADYADTFVSYSHDAILWTVASGLCASFALDTNSLARIGRVAAFSGFCAGMALCTKQSIGGGAIVGIPIVAAFLLLRLKGWRQGAAFFTAYLVGCAIPIGIFLAWLGSLGIVGSFLQQVFVRGPAAKNLGGTQYIRRVILVAGIYAVPLIMALVAIPFLWRAVLRSDRVGSPRSERPSNQLVLTFLMASLSIAAGAILSYRGAPNLPFFVKSSMYVVLIASPVLGIYYGLLRWPISTRQAHYCLFASVSFIVAFTVSLSWPAYETMLLPGIGFLFAAAIEKAGPVGRWIGLCIASLLLLTATCNKLNAPEGFEDFIERPVREATQRSSLPEMSGFLLPRPMVDLLDGTVRIVGENTSPGDTIFSYPGLGLFHTLTNRRWPTLSGDENVDVVNDSLAKEEALTLLSTRPKVIIYFREPESYLRELELTRRSGRRMGQRDIIAAVEQLIGSYRLAGTFEGSSPAQKVLVYVER